MISLLGAVILILDIFAIVSVLLGSSSVMRKIMWIAIVLVLPVIGMVLYFLIGRNAFDAQV
ncbi:MAG: PLDc N-terminal domain-containing protein [Planctomycetaceae bacterium]